VWFNQAHLFHISSLPEDIRQSLAELYTEADLPRQAYYGDGAAIEVAALDEVRRAYRQASVTFPWKAGDVVLVDNLLVAHGRRPFSGPRRVLVAMAEPMR
jgi:alpha-ketoglutarate-dependent taurine dioxygenase